MKVDERHICQIIQSVVHKKVYLHPVGNHHLERHFVYHIFDDQGFQAIFKLYMKKNRWNREVAALKLLEHSDVKCPKLLGCGILDNDTEWLMIEYLDGKAFDQVEEQVSEEDKRIIYEEMGRELGKIHQYKAFDFFGNWNEIGSSVENIKDYETYFTAHMQTVFDEINKQELKEKELLKAAVKKLKQDYHLLTEVKTAHLCHNDFSERNVLVTRLEAGWRLAAVIDFEQSMPSDKDRDLVYIRNILCCKDKDYEAAFIKGYQTICPIEEGYQKKKEFYQLYIGLYICSWAAKQAPDHYQEGIEILKRVMKVTE